MKKLKKFIGAGLALGLLALSIAYPVTVAAEGANRFPAANVGVHDKLDFYGLKTKRISATTTAALLFSGEGFLDSICAFGGTSGKYSLAFDTGGETVAAQDLITASKIASYVISPRVYTAVDTASSNGGNLGCWVPPAPIKFVNGLYGANNDSGHTALFFVHCSTGSNPCNM